MVRASGRAPLATALIAVGLSAALVSGTAVPRVQAHRAQSTLFINGQGSTFVQPLMARWAFVYSNNVDKSTRVNYQGTGSGAGITAFTSGLVDFAGTDAFLNATQLAALK